MTDGYAKKLISVAQRVLNKTYKRRDVLVRGISVFDEEGVNLLTIDLCYKSNAPVYVERASEFHRQVIQAFLDLGETRFPTIKHNMPDAIELRHLSGEAELQSA